MLDKVRLLDATNMFEKQFSYNHYNGFDFHLLPFDIKLGTNPILISAPHAVNHIRNNRVKNADLYTGAIASIVQSYTNSFLIYSNRICDEDPNYTIGGQYKSALKNLCNNNQIDYIVDLHGASRERNFDIDLGTMNGESIDENSINKIINIFRENGVKDVKNNAAFTASHPGTITSFSKNTLHIKAVQIEINRFYRDPNHFEAYASLIKSLIEIIEHLKKG
ncbi:hypothetical protein [Niallia sp. Krafla_26]|uniref:hypothetical protein n=1 Tax=Niallia sp. Krafla_26 TaxID=3064703 RepID=UPI003D1839D1